MQTQNYNRAFGVYGIYVENDKLLVINKNGGPYINRYDLPGGSLEAGESLSIAMKREFLEETGADSCRRISARLLNGIVYISFETC